MSDYSIEARSLDIVGVASHDFLLLRDDRGRAIAELHGLATDRETGKVEPIGTDENKHSLRIWHYAHDREYAESLGASPSRTTYIADGQDKVTLLKADKEEILSRWNAAVAAKESLNALDLNYPNYGFRMSGDTVNSNSAYRTLSEIMGVPVHDFPGKLEPGLDNRMVDQKEIERVRTHGYPSLDTPSVKTNGEYKPLEALPPQPEPSPGSSPSAFSGSRTQGDRDAQYDARSPSHPGHADYARIREGLAGSVQDPQLLDNVTASAYREMAANPQMKQVDYVGAHNGNAVLAYAPHGLGREPMFTAHTDIAQAQRQPADDNLGRAQAIVETRALTQAQEQQSQQQSQIQTQSGPALSIGARTV